MRASKFLLVKVAKWPLLAGELDHGSSSSNEGGSPSKEKINPCTHYLPSFLPEKQFSFSFAGRWSDERRTTAYYLYILDVEEILTELASL